MNNEQMAAMILKGKCPWCGKPCKLEQDEKYTTLTCKSCGVATLSGGKK